MKKELYLATVNLPSAIDPILCPHTFINSSMYILQGKEILVKKANDPDYDFLDFNLYILENNTWTVKKRNQRLINSLLRKGVTFIDCAFWCESWLKDIHKAEK